VDGIQKEKKQQKRPFVCPTALMPRRRIVLLPERVSSYISRCAAHTKRRERPLLAKEGTVGKVNMELLLDATITVLLISKISSTCFGQTFAHLQERKT
jgi:hypothetical protein